MPKRALILPLVAAAWLPWGPTSLSAGPPFSAEHLARAMNTHQNWAALEVQLGNYSLPDPAFGPAPAAIINAFVQHGLVTRTPNGFNQIITATPKGVAMARDSGLPQRPGFLRIRAISYQVTKLIKSEPLRSATGSWQYALCTYTRDAGPVNATVDAQQPRPYLRDRKAKVLLQYDEVTSQWVLKGWDSANLNEEFDTNNIDQGIVALGLRRE